MCELLRGLKSTIINSVVKDRRSDNKPAIPKIKLDEGNKYNLGEYVYRFCMLVLFMRRVEIANVDAMSKNIRKVGDSESKS